MGKLICKTLVWATVVTICASLLFGIYLRGKQMQSMVVLAAEDGVSPSAADMRTMCGVLHQRIKAFGKEFGIVRGEVGTTPDGRIAVKLRSKGGCEPFLEQLTRRGVMEFRLVAPGYKDDMKSAPEGYEMMPLRRKMYSLEDIGEMEEVVEYLPVEKEPELTVLQLKAVSVHTSGIWAKPVVTISFNEEDARTFAQITSRNLGRRLAVVIDGDVVAAPAITAPIKDGTVRIEGLGALSPARRLARVLEMGATPFPVKVVEVVGAAGKREAVNSGTLRRREGGDGGS